MNFTFWAEEVDIQSGLPCKYIADRNVNKWTGTLPESQRGEKLSPHQWQSKARYQAKCVKDTDSQVMDANAKRKGKGKESS